MSTHSLPANSIYLRMPPRVGIRHEAVQRGLSFSGFALFLMCLSLVGSGFDSMRPTIFGLKLHPHLLPMALAAPFFVIGRFSKFPHSAFLGGAVFLATYCGATLAAPGAISESVKICISGASVLCPALMIRRRADFVAGVLGLNIAMAVIAVYSLLHPTADTGINPLVFSSKNTYSLFAHGPMLLAAFSFVRMPEISKSIKAILAVCVLVSTAVIFMSANRSGYVGCMIIAFAVLWERKFFGWLVIGMAVLVIGFLVHRMGATGTLTDRLESTFHNSNASSSDNLRQELIKTCFAIGLRNPLMGVSPQRLGDEIGYKLSTESDSLGRQVERLDSHNVVAHLWGGTGLICFSSLVFTFRSLWFWRLPTIPSTPMPAAHRLLRLLILLWIIRGSFTQQILYSPGFCMCFGLVIGLCLLETSAAGKPLVAGVSGK